MTLCKIISVLIQLVGDYIEVIVCSSVRALFQNIIIEDKSATRILETERTKARKGVERINHYITSTVKVGKYNNIKTQQLLSPTITILLLLCILLE